jgi:hypothetical protein
VIGAAPVGVLSEDLQEACLGALKLLPEACLRFAAAHTWEASARAFVGNISRVRADLGENAKPSPEQPAVAT